MWQDIYLLVASFLFIGALVPSILSKDKPAMWSSIMTSVLLLGTLIVYTSLGLVLAAGGCALTLIAWVILLVQKVHIKIKETPERLEELKSRVRNEIK